MSPHWVDRSLAQSKKDLSLFIICILSWGQCINFQANVVMHNFYNLIFLYSAICNIKIIENALSPHTHPPNTIQRPQVRTEDIKLRFSLRSEVFGACRMGRILFFWFSGIRKASGLRQILWKTATQLHSLWVDQAKFFYMSGSLPHLIQQGLRAEGGPTEVGSFHSCMPLNGLPLPTSLGRICASGGSGYSSRDISNI